MSETETATVRLSIEIDLTPYDILGSTTDLWAGQVLSAFDDFVGSIARDWKLKVKPNESNLLARIDGAQMKKVTIDVAGSRFRRARRIRRQRAGPRRSRAAARAPSDCRKLCSAACSIDSTLSR